MTEPDDLELGPIDYLVVEYPNGEPTGEALPYLLDLVDQGVIRLLDFAVVSKAEDGSATALSLDELAQYGADQLSVFAGAGSGLLDKEDIAETAAILSPGAMGAILVYENTWAAPFATALRKSGAQLVANGRIAVNDLIAALDEADEENV
ncbi:MAG: DUF6325 family protein [Candidatus Nanopelagicales bacterium]